MLKTRFLCVVLKTRFLCDEAPLPERGVGAQKGAIHVKRLTYVVTDDPIGLPEGVRVYLAQIEGLSVQITALDQKMKDAAKESEAARWAQTMPCVGLVTALAKTFAPDLTAFARATLTFSVHVSEKCCPI